MVLFKDLNKDARDSLTKDFCHDKSFQTEVKHLGRQPLTLKAALGARDDYDASVKQEFRFGGKVLCECNAGITSPSNLILKYNGHLGDGVKGEGDRLKYTVGAMAQQCVRREGTKNTAEIFTEINQQKFHGRAAFNALGCQWNASGLYQLPMCRLLNGMRVFVGGDVNGRMDLTSVAGCWGVKAVKRVDQFEYITSVRSLPNSKVVVNLMTRRLSNNKKDDSAEPKSTPAGSPGNMVFREIAAEVRYSMLENKPTVSFAGKFDIDDDFVKAKITHDRKIALAYKHTALSFANITFGVEYPLANGGKDNFYSQPRVGVKLDLKSS